MQVILTAHAEQLLQEQLARRAGQATPEQIIEHALEQLALAEPEVIIGPEQDARLQAIADMQAFAAKHQLRLERGSRSLRDFVHEGHKY
jgi:hypothetical protein